LVHRNRNGYYANHAGPNLDASAKTAASKPAHREGTTITQLSED